MLAEALAPQYLVVWADDPAAPEVDSPPPTAPVVRVQPGTVLAGPLAVEWQADSDGDAAVVVACRIAGRSGAPLELRADGDTRRLQGMLEARSSGSHEAVAASSEARADGVR